MASKKYSLEKLEKIRVEVKTKYEKIRKIYCPALKSNIVFNSNGLHHLRYDENRSERSKKSQYGKLLCFDDAVNILKVSTTVQEYRRALHPVGKKDKNGLRKTKVVEWFGIFAVTSFSNKIRINVIVRRIGGDDGNYHFWSVMPCWNLSNEIRTVGSKKIENG